MTAVSVASRQVLGPRLLLVAAALALLVAVPAAAELCDADGDGMVTDVDGVNALRAAAGLSSLCTPASCDVDGNGAVGDPDAVAVLHGAALLPGPCGPGVTLTPPATMLTVGESRFYAAVLRHPDGTTENVTQRADYASSAPTVAAAPNAAGEKSRVDALAPGTATISAVDPVTGLGSSPAGDATMTVLGPLESLVLAPAVTTLTIGESRFYTATGHFGGGGTQNLTQRVDYASSDPAVAVATNAPGAKSEIQAVGSGVTTISAVDPETGVSSSPAGDATLTVLGALESLTLAPAVSSLAVGGSRFYTATGHFAGGGTQNLTQRVDYASSDPAVAVAPNAAGAKSRIDAVGAGTTTISAVDPVTGVGSSPAGDAELTVEAP